MCQQPQRRRQQHHHHHQMQLPAWVCVCVTVFIVVQYHTNTTGVCVLAGIDAGYPPTRTGGDAMEVVVGGPSSLSQLSLDPMQVVVGGQVVSVQHISVHAQLTK
jgi:hypothetical protein